MEDYQIISAAGHGAYGVVFKAKHRVTGSIVAIKKFKDGHQRLRATVAREIRMLEKLQHPKVVQLKHKVLDGDRVQLVFEYVEQNLLQLLEKSSGGAMPLPHVRIIMWQLFGALHHCHSNGVVHRDIKPENLLVDNGLDLRLCDFGFARQIGNDANQRLPNIVPLTDYVATRWYRSPELLLSDGHYGYEVDVWAAGCIMGEILDGRPLFPGKCEVDQVRTIQKIVGPLSSEQQSTCLRHHRFGARALPPAIRSAYRNLEQRYLGRCDRQGIDLVYRCVTCDPANRCTAKDALNHPFFDALRSPSVPVTIRSTFGQRRQASCPNDAVELSKDSNVTIETAATTAASLRDHGEMTCGTNIPEQQEKKSGLQYSGLQCLPEHGLLPLPYRIVQQPCQTSKSKTTANRDSRWGPHAYQFDGFHEHNRKRPLDEEWRCADENARNRPEGTGGGSFFSNLGASVAAAVKATKLPKSINGWSLWPGNKPKEVEAPEKAVRNSLGFLEHLLSPKKKVRSNEFL